MGVMDAQAALGGVRLCICNFLTNTRPNTSVDGVPSWNTYADDLAEATFTVAYELMVAGGMQTLLLAVFVRDRDIGLVQWQYNRAAGQEAAFNDGFGKRVDML
ncbi:hypothetical protein L7F22_023505 [Adiantum nelumboides]|nr:hypothetical protein [Adiantum nelumboides]